MAKLNLIYRTFDGFARAFAQQAASFRQTHPDVEFNIVPRDPALLYETMVKGRGALQPEFDVRLILTDWLPELIRSGGLVPLNDSLPANPPPDWPEGWSPSMRQLQQDS